MGISPLIGGSAVFLDRDGVINAPIVRSGQPFAPLGIKEFVILESARKGVLKLQRAGFPLIIVTNQPEIARGRLAIADLKVMHQQIRSELGISHFRVCPHDDSDGCACRKPQPGMLVDAAIELNIDLSRSFMIGDRWKDIQAGATAGCRTIFIKQSYSEVLPRAYDYVAGDLDEAAELILSTYSQT